MLHQVKSVGIMTARSVCSVLCTCTCIKIFVLDTDVSISIGTCLGRSLWCAMPVIQDKLLDGERCCGSTKLSWNTREDSNTPMQIDWPDNSVRTAHNATRSLVRRWSVMKLFSRATRSWEPSTYLPIKTNNDVMLCYVQQLTMWNYQCNIISFNYLLKQAIEILLKDNKGAIQNPRMALGSITMIKIVTLWPYNKMMELFEV